MFINSYFKQTNKERKDYQLRSLIILLERKPKKPRENLTNKLTMNYKTRAVAILFLLGMTFTSFSLIEAKQNLRVTSFGESATVKNDECMIVSASFFLLGLFPPALAFHWDRATTITLLMLNLSSGTTTSIILRLPIPMAIVGACHTITIG